MADVATLKDQIKTQINKLTEHEDTETADLQEILDLLNDKIGTDGNANATGKQTQGTDGNTTQSDPADETQSGKGE